ncbi:MAG: Peptidyl-lysine N-acetyltransferase YjaB [Desulfovibrio sp.]
MTAVIRTMTPRDGTALHTLWERSVRATHTFLSEEDIAFYSPMVRDMFAQITETAESAESAETPPETPPAIFVAHEENGPPLGFMVLDSAATPAKLEALFIDPAHARKGIGTLFVEYAITLHPRIALDVNEQNPGARAFYARLGFRETGRSPLDGAGKPFPLIHMVFAR